MAKREESVLRNVRVAIIGGFVFVLSLVGWGVQGLNHSENNDLKARLARIEQCKDAASVDACLAAER